MMTEKARALYDFEAQPSSGELSLKEGDTVTVINKNIGDGWWEGTNDQGETGFFPEQYVEIVDGNNEAPPSMAPPPLPADYSSNNQGWSASAINQQQSDNAPTSAPASNRSWGNDDWGFSSPPPLSEIQQQQQEREHSWGYVDGDDWESEDEFEGQQPATVAGSAGFSNSLAPPASNLGQSGSSGDITSLGKEGSKKNVQVAATGRTNFYRFSPFVKSGGEDYVLGKINVNVQESDVIQVVDNGDDTYSWLHVKPAYSCKISSHKKDSKFGGLKSYTAYQLTPSFNNIQVSRRYKRFDWLHERLVEKFSIIPVPPLPDKQIQGRYEEEFIERRMDQLQNFVDRVSTHPILSQCEVWNHFLTCTDDRRWKDGKRAAEKDPLVGGSFFMTIKVPDRPLGEDFVERQLEMFNKFSGRFEGAVKNLLKVSAEQTTKNQTAVKREFQTVGKAFLQLGQAMEQDGLERNVALNNAVNCTGEAYEEIAKIVDAQPKNDWEPYGDVMHDYRGMLACWPGAVSIHHGAAGKRRECEKLYQDGKVSRAELNEIGSRSDVISYATLAEINTFHQTRAKDLKLAQQNFLRGQIHFYQKITEKLQDALREYDNC